MKKQQSSNNHTADQNLYLKTILQTTTDGFWVVDKNRRMVDVNEAYLKMVGYTRREFLTLTINDVDAEEDTDKTSRRIERIITNGSELFETKHRKKDGSIIDVEISATFIDKEGGQFICFCRNITQRLAAKQRLEENEQKYRMLVENTHSIAWEFDIILDKWVYVAPQTESILGYETNEWTNLEFWASRLHPNDREWATHYCMECTAKGENHTFEYQFRKKSGQYIWLRDVVSVEMKDRKPVKLRGLMFDITERKQWEQKLLVSDRVFNHALDMLCIAGFDGYFKTLNPAWSKTLGWSTEELLSKPWVEFVHPDDRKATENVKSVIVDGEEVYQFENRYICKDGSVKWLSWNSFPYPKENIMFGVARDITYKKQAEEKLFKSELKLKEQVEEYVALNEELNQANEELRNLMENLSESTQRNSALVAANPDLMFVYNREGVFLDYHTPNPKELLIKPEEFLHKRSDEVLPKYLADINQQAINQLFETGKPQTYSYSLDIDGNVYHYDARMVRYGNDKVLAIVRDITERKKAEEEIALLASMLDLAPSAITVHDMQGNFLYSNEHNLNLHGYSIDELMRKNLHEIDTPENEKKVEERINLVKHNGEASFEVEHYRKDGTQFPLMLLVKLVTWKGQPALLSIGTDLTELQKTQESLRANEERLRTISDNMFDLVSLTDIEGNFKFVSASHRILGYDHQSLIGSNIMEFVHPDDLQYVTKAFGDFLKKPKEDAKVEYRYRCAYGGYLWFETVGRFILDSNGKPKEILFNTRDFSERKQMEDSLRKSEERYRSLYESTSAMLHSIDKEGRIISVSNTWLEKLGYSKDEVIGKKSIDFLTKESKRKAVEVYLPEFFQKGMSKDAYYQMVTKSGEVLDVLMSAVAEKTDYQGFVRSMAVIEDITEKKKAEEELRSVLQELKESNQRINAILMAIPDLMFVLNREGVYIDYYSPDDSLLAAKPQEFLGKKAFDILPDKVAQSTKKAIEQLFEEGVTQSYSYSLEINKKIHYYDARLVLFGNEKVLAIIRDITEQKNAEKDLRESEEKYRTLFETMREGVFYQDADGVLIDANQATLDMFGITKDQFFGRTSYHPEWKVVDSERNTLPPEQHPSMLALTTRKPVLNLEVGVFNPQKNDYTWMLVNAIPQFVGSSKKPHSVFVTLSDITSRKNFEETLKQRNTFIQTVLDNLPIGVALNTINEGKATYLNKKFQEIYGWGEEDIRSIASFFEKVYPDKQYRDEIMGRVLADIQSGDPDRMHWENLTVTRKDGSKGIINAVNIPMLEQNTMVSTVMDVTEQKKAESEQKKLTMLLDSIRNAQSLYIAQDDTQPVFDSLLNTLLEITESEFGFLDEVFYEPDGTPYKLSLAISNISWDKDSEKLYKELRERNLEFRNLNNLAGLPALNKKSIIANDVSADKRAGGLPNGHPGIKSFMGLPVFYGKEVVGVIGVANRTKDYTEELAKFLEPYLNACAGIIQDIRMRKKEKEMVSTIRESEEKYRNLFEANTDGIAIFRINPDDTPTKFIEANTSAASMLGYSIDEFAELYMNQLEVDVKQEEQKNRVNKLKTNGIAEFETQLLHKKGHFIHVNVKALVINYLNQPAVLNITRDITERKKAEQALRESEESFRMLAELAPVGIIITDKFQNPAYASPAFTKIFGYTINDIPTVNHWFMLAYPDEKFRNTVKQEWFEFLEVVKKDGGFATPLEYPVHCRNGSIKQIEFRLAVSGDINVVIFSDVTERNEAEQALRESEERFRGLYENATVGIYRTTPDGQILMANPALMKMIGYDSFEELTKRNLSKEQYEPEYPREEFIRKIEEKGEVRGLESAWRKKDGTSIYVSESARAFRNEKGKIVYYEGIVEDITERKKAVDALRASEERIQSIFRVAPIGIGVVKERVFTEINPRLCQMTGYTSEELLGKSARMLYPTQEEFENVGTQKYNQIAEKGTGSVETRWVKKGGEIIDILLSSTPIVRGDNSQGVTFTALDITERNLAVNALKNSEEQYRLLFENMTQGFALHKIITNDNGKAIDYKYLTVNPAFEKLTGIKAKDIIGKTILEVMPQTEDYWIETYGKVAETMKPIKYENYAQELKKHFEVSAFSPQKGFFAVVFTDVTKRKQAEDKVQMLSKGIEQSPAIVVITSISGEIEYVNPRFSEVTGYSLKEALGQNPRILKSGNQSKHFYENLWSTILSGNDWSGEILNRKKSGETYWESALISPITDDNGQIKHFIAIKEDISERKEAEKALKEKNEEYLVLNEELQESNDRIKGINRELIAAREKALESDRLKTAFLANMSHEIRTPMNSIIGFSEFLLKPTLKPERKEFFARILNASCHQLLNVVNDMIDIAKIETGQIEIHKSKTNINELINRIYNIYNSQIDKNKISLIVSNNLPDEACVVSTDSVKVSQIITNLVSNAVKFTENGEIEMGYNIIQNEIKFFVRDTGIGIAPENHELIFERFRQVEMDTTRNYGGTGLGLPICKAFVEELGGKIWLESEVGAGSTFFFTVPYEPEKAVAKENSHTNLQQTFNFTGKTILVAEDEEANILLLNEIILETGANIIVAKNGSEAVNQFKKHKNVDIVLMDIKMPVLNGIEATKKIRSISKTIPIIALTAYALSGDKEKCFKAGCNGYISKPILQMELLELIKKHVKV